MLIKFSLYTEEYDWDILIMGERGVGINHGHIVLNHTRKRFLKRKSHYILEVSKY